MEIIKDLGHTRYPGLCKLEELILWLQIFSFIMLIYQDCNKGNTISGFACFSLIKLRKQQGRHLFQANQVFLALHNKSLSYFKQ